MNLTLLKAEPCFVAWVDGAHVQTGENLTILFGRLSHELRTAAEEKEPVVATIETKYGEKEYLPFTPEETKRAREQLSLFGVALS